MICPRCHKEKFRSAVHGQIELCEQCWEDLAERWKRKTETTEAQEDYKYSVMLYFNGEITEVEE